MLWQTFVRHYLQVEDASVIAHQTDFPEQTNKYELKALMPLDQTSRWLISFYILLL